MRLSLTVIGAAAGGLAPQTCKSWVDRGGTIGRAEDNDWVLPDPGQEISRCHAKIRFMNDGFYMEDASANGVFLNDRGNRLAPGELHRLQDGERLFVSDYQIAVQVDEDDLAAEPATPSTRGDPGYDPGEYAGGSGDYAEWDPLQSLGGKVETPSASVEAPPGGNRARQSYLEEHFSPAPVRPETPAPQPPPQGGGEASVIPADWWKKPAPGEDAPAPKPSPEPAVVAPVVPSPGAGNPRRAGGEGVVSPAVAGPPPPQAQTHGDGPRLPTSWWEQPSGSVDAVTPDTVPEPPAVGGAPEPAPAPGAAAVPPPQEEKAPAAQPAPEAANRDSLGRLLEGAGIAADQMTAETAEQLGRILRVAVAGIMDLLRARSEIKNEFRMPVTLIQARENNPLKFSTNVEDALHNLLVKHNPDYLAPVAAFEASFDDLRSHQVAMLAGMRQAFMEMLDRFDPEKLAPQFEEKGKQGAVMGRIGRRRNWDLYQALFAAIREDMDANFHRLFGESFIQAYEAQMARLQQPSRGQSG